LAPLRALDVPLADFTGLMAFVEAQKIYDPEYPSGHRYYWKSTNLDALSEPVLDVLVERMLAAPSKHSTIDVWLNGGAMERVSESHAAFRGRDARYVVNPEANWEDDADDDPPPADEVERVVDGAPLRAAPPDREDRDDE